MLTLLFWLLVGHVLADFALQSEGMARGKNPNYISDNIPFGQKRQTVWPYWLTAHALIHAGLVALITGFVLLGVLEFVLHWAIDWFKCQNFTGIHSDQALHVLCKILYLILV